jgi:uncharacterized SAM-binding protein YcdF (DUF218 family)
MTLFVFLKYLSQLAMPPASLFIGLAIAFVFKLLRFRRLAVLVATLSLVELLVLSFPPVGDLLIERLEDEARAAARAAPPCCYQVIVLLGGGMQPAMPPYLDFPALNPSADRIWLAARLYHAHVAPRIVVTGGSFRAKEGEPATTEADAMRVFLVALGVPSEAIVSEGEALNTIENMRFVRAIVKDERVALVTSAYHMPRSLRIARAVGLNVEAFPTDFRSIREIRTPWENWIPSGDGLGNSGLALHEYAALYLDFRAPR